MATKFLTLSGGIPRMQIVSSQNVTGDETLVVGAGGISSSSTSTIPNGLEYTDIDLEVYLNGQFLEEGQEYSYVGTAPRNQVQWLINLVEGDRVRFRVEGDSVGIYDEVLVVGSGGITTGTNITLPNGGSFDTDIQIELYLAGQFLELNEDYNIVGSTPYTQVQMTFDLVEGDRLRFRNDIP
jgi:hypothetical protein